MPRRSRAAALAVLALVGANAGCGRDDGPSTEGTTIEVVFADGDVTPKGERVQVEQGTPVTFAIDADAGGTLHIHTTPEQELEYAAGQSAHEITVEQPGVVEVESHELDVVIVQLQVS